MAKGSDPHYFRNHRRGIAVWALVAALGFGGLGLWHLRTWAWRPKPLPTTA